VISPSMQFRLVEGRSPLGLTRWIQATGRITPDTPGLFRNFVRRNPVRGLTVVLDSPGGAMEGGLALGRAFRSAGVNTLIGRTAVAVEPGRSATILTHSIECNSACSYAFLGGNRRSMTPDAIMALHQFSRRREADGRYVSATPSNEDFHRAQQLTTELALYLQEMGVDLRMMRLAAAHPYGSTYHAVRQAELVDLRIGTPAAFAEADVEPSGWSEGIHPDQPLLYRRLSSAPSAEIRVDSDIALTCGAEGAIAVRARAILARAGPGQIFLVSQVQVRLGSRHFGQRLPELRQLRLMTNQSVRYNFEVPRQTLIEAAERDELAVEATGLGEPIELGGGLGRMLPQLLAACDARRPVATATR
jgi:hypothetical protein